MKIKEIYEIVKWIGKTLYETYFPERNKIEKKFEDEVIFMTSEESRKLKDELGLKYEEEPEEVFMTLEESRDRKNKITEELNQMKKMVKVVEKGLTLPFTECIPLKENVITDDLKRTIPEFNIINEDAIIKETYNTIKETYNTIVEIIESVKNKGIVIDGEKKDILVEEYENLKDTFALLRKQYISNTEEEDLNKFDELINEKEQSLSTCIKDYNTLKITIPAKEPLITDDLKHIVKGLGKIDIDAFTSVDKEKMEESVEVLKKTMESLRNQGIIFAGEEDLDKLKKRDDEE